MAGDRRGRVSDLYHAALERAPETRSEFLRQACQGDEALRAEVESLLQYESASAQFLERLPSPDLPSVAVTTMVGRQLGPVQDSRADRCRRDGRSLSRARPKAGS